MIERKSAKFTGGARKFCKVLVDQKSPQNMWHVRYRARQLLCAMGFQVPFPVTIRTPVVAMLMSEGYLPRGYWTRHPRSGLVPPFTKPCEVSIHGISRNNKSTDCSLSRIGQIYLPLHHFIAAHWYSPPVQIPFLYRRPVTMVAAARWICRPR